MAYFQPIYTYAFLLAVIACHQILLTEGRQLKSMKKQDFNTIEERRNLVSPTQTLGSGNIEAGNVDDFRPTTPGNSPGVGHSFEEHNVDVEPEALGNGSTVGSSLAGNTDDSRPTVPEQGNVDDFRPTTPGYSPGAGHSFEEHNVDVEPEALGNGSTVESSIAGNTDDFRPTVPGHSPGVGHSLQTKKTEPNA
ncbi:hypothetical protein LguiB_009246 [Lonicera macranthoides]